jgi:hypothetical protein
MLSLPSSTVSVLCAHAAYVFWLLLPPPPLLLLLLLRSSLSASAVAPPPSSLSTRTHGPQALSSQSELLCNRLFVKSGLACQASWVAVAAAARHVCGP